MNIGGMLSGLGGSGGFDPGKLTTAVGDLFASKGGVDGLIGTLRDGGLGGAVDSWVSTGANQAVDPQQLGAALGPETTAKLAQDTGLSIPDLLPMLASFLPMIINHLTPGGQVPAGGTSGGLGDLGGLIGGALGGGGSGLGDLLGGGLGGNLGGGQDKP